MIKKIYNISLISSILLFVFGLLMAINSEAFLKTMTIILGVILIIIGVFPIFEYFRTKGSLGAGIGLISGIFSVVCGLMFLFNEDMLMILVPVFIGVWMIINGINKIQLALQLRDDNENTWIITFVYSIIIVILGGFFVIKPVSGANIVATTIGIILCIYAIFDIVDCILIKIKVKKIVDEVKEIDSNVVDEQ